MRWRSGESRRTMVIDGHWGYFVLVLSIPPAPPLCSHSDAYLPTATMLKDASKSFLFPLCRDRCLQANVKLGLSFSQIFQNDCYDNLEWVFPPSPHPLLWGFLGSLLSVKTPYVGFNSGHMLCAASVVPASVSSSALSAADDSVACFAVACFAFCSCSNTALYRSSICLAPSPCLCACVYIQSGHVCDIHGFNMDKTNVISGHKNMEGWRWHLDSLNMRQYLKKNLPLRLKSGALRIFRSVLSILPVELPLLSFAVFGWLWEFRSVDLPVHLLPPSTVTSSINSNTVVPLAAPQVHFRRLLPPCLTDEVMLQAMSRCFPSPYFPFTTFISSLPYVCETPWSLALFWTVLMHARFQQGY